MGCVSLKFEHRYSVWLSKHRSLLLILPKYNSKFILLCFVAQMREREQKLYNDTKRYSTWVLMTAVSKITPPTHHRIGLLNSMPPPQARSDSLSPHTCLKMLFIAMARGLRLQNLDSGFRRQKHFFGSQLQLYNLILLFQRALHCNVEFSGAGEGASNFSLCIPLQEARGDWKIRI